MLLRLLVQDLKEHEIMEAITLKKSPVVFDKETHTYTLNGQELKGVTPIISWLFPETYAGIPAGIMQASAEYGSMIHSACQLYDLIGIAEHDAVKAYQKLKEQHGLETIANEYLVSDEMSIASSIDVVCRENGNTGDALIDIKTTSKVHDVNLAVQLSIYAWLYEWQTGREVGNLYCLWLPKPRYGSPALFPIQRVSKEICKQIVIAYVTGCSNNYSRQLLQDAGLVLTGLQVKGEEIPAQYQDVVEEVISIEEQLKAMKEREKALKDGLLELMRSAGVKKWESDNLTLTYVAPTTRKALDSTKLKREYPDVYNACIKESNVSDSIKITTN